MTFNCTTGLSYIIIIIIIIIISSSSSSSSSSIAFEKIQPLFLFHNSKIYLATINHLA